MDSRLESPNLESPKEYRSKCCNAEVKTEGMPDFIGSREICTVHYVCLKCGEPCDIQKK